MPSKSISRWLIFVTLDFSSLCSLNCATKWHNVSPLVVKWVFAVKMKPSWVSSVYFNCTAKAVLKVVPKPKAFFLLLVLTDNWRHDLARPQRWERCYLPRLVLKVCYIWLLDCSGTEICWSESKIKRKIWQTEKKNLGEMMVMMMKW